ncbi:MAG: PhoX family protein [Angustibacter sp.]
MSGNPSFSDVVGSALSRRALLQAAGVAVASGAALTAVRSSPAWAAPASSGGTIASPGGEGAFNFRGISPQSADLDELVVPAGYDWAPVISWGDPILPGAPDFDFDNQTAKAQAGQFGYNNDYTTLIPIGRNRAILVCNNEYTNEELMFRLATDGPTDEQLRIVQMAHGMSIVEVRRSSATAPWRYQRDGARNRRITARTPFTVVGPAAGSSLLRTSSDPTGRRVLGTLGNCAGGTTPWGTVLSGEENFQGYFKSVTAAPIGQAEAYRRYGIVGEQGRGWERIDQRFDTTVEPNEPNRFGWIVEVDPVDPDATPRKLTALGRFRHEGATTVSTRDGRIAVYMGDDQRFDYTYKFVSAKRMRPGTSAADRAHNLTLLEEGDLYVARFTGDGTDDGSYDGTGEWLPLAVDGRSAVPGMSLEQVLVWTRLAADRAGATAMDRPEDVETNPRNGRVYLVCTNNSDRAPSQVDEANPRPANKHGHIVEITPRGSDHGAAAFTWSLVLVAGDPQDPSTYFAGFDKSRVSPISCPDNIAFDAAGNLWIATDGNQLDACDGLYAMPVQGPGRGHLRQFLSVPTGAETCGPVVTADSRTILVAVQHPGEVDGASPDDPASRFPYRGGGQPRPSVVQVQRRDGGPIIRR